MFPISRCSYSRLNNMILKELVRLTTLVSLIISTYCVGEPPLETIKQWNLVNFNFPYDWPVNDKDLFNAEQIVTTGLEVGSHRIFLATPRLFSGVPATISSVSRDTVEDSPVLKVNSIDRRWTSQLKCQLFSRHILIGPITLPVWSNTIAATSVWSPSIVSRLTRATGCGRSMLACRDPSKISKSRAHRKFLSTIWIQIRLSEGL